jgi:hypothetical protein
MPQLVEYVNKENLQTTDRGTEAAVQQGRRIGASYNQVAEGLRDFGNRVGQNIGGAIRDAGDAAAAYQTHREISQGVGSYALLQDSLITQWNDTAKNADPNDPMVRQQFIEQKLTPSLQKWSDAFQTEGGQKWAQERQRALLDHMYEKTAADMGTLAGQAVITNIRTYGNTVSNTAMRDPSSVPHLLSETDASIGAMVDSSPTLKGAMAGRVRTEEAEKRKEAIVKAGAIGAIQASSDPEKTADEWTRKYPQYISGEEARILGQNARQQIRARDADQRSAEHFAKQEAIDRSAEKTNDYLLKMTAANPKFGDPWTQQVLNDNDLTKQDKRNLISFRERELKPETQAALSQQTFIGLLRELRQPDVDTRALEQKAWDARLTDAGKPGSMTQPDFDRFRKELLDRKTPDGAALAHDRDEFFKRYIATIDPQRDKATGLGGSALGDQKIYEATAAARQQEAILKAKGQDPHSLYDPASPNFFGKQISRFRPTLSEQTAFDAQVKADKGSKEPSATAATFEQRFGGETAPKPAAAESPRPGARQAPDGNWYVEKDGKFFRVDKK